MIDGNTRGDAHCLSGLLCFTGNTVQNTTIPMRPFCVFVPVANAVPAAAEQVTAFVAE